MTYYHDLDETIMNENLKHRRFMDLAEHIATWSKDPSTKVSAILVDGTGHIISTGYNGWPRHLDDNLYLDIWDTDRENARQLKNKHMIHAEENALNHAVADIKGSTLYITHPPCSECTQKLVDRGVSCVVYLEADDDFSGRWSCEESFNILSVNFIPVISLKRKTKL